MNEDTIPVCLDHTFEPCRPGFPIGPSGPSNPTSPGNPGRPCNEDDQRELPHSSRLLLNIPEKLLSYRQHDFF